MVALGLFLGENGFGVWLINALIVVSSDDYVTR